MDQLVGFFKIIEAPVEKKFRDSIVSTMVVEIPAKSLYKRVIGFILRERPAKLVVKNWSKKPRLALRQLEVGDKVWVRGNFVVYNGRVKLPGGGYLRQLGGDYFLTKKLYLSSSTVIPA